TSLAWANFQSPTTSSSKNGCSHTTAIILPEQISERRIFHGVRGRNQRFYLTDGRTMAIVISCMWTGILRTAIMPLMQAENTNGEEITDRTSFRNMQRVQTAQQTQLF